jgi:hypothetical protein
MHGFAQNMQSARKLFWAHPMKLIVDVGQVEAHFGLLGDGVNLSVR